MKEGSGPISRERHSGRAAHRREIEPDADRSPARWRFRFPVYLLLWTLLIAPVSFGVEHVFRETLIVPECKAWGRDRNVAFASYSHGGGQWTDLLNVTGSYSRKGCYFTGGHPNFATLREIGGGTLSWMAALGGPSTVLAAIVLTTIAVVLPALAVEGLLRRRRLEGVMTR